MIIVPSVVSLSFLVEMSLQAPAPPSLDLLGPPAPAPSLLPPPSYEPPVVPNEYQSVIRPVQEEITYNDTTTKIVRPNGSFASQYGTGDIIEGTVFVLLFAVLIIVVVYFFVGF